MAKDREIICRFYERAGVCSISKKQCTVRREMQHCGKYEPIKGAQPIRANTRQRRLDRARKLDKDT